MSNKDLVETKPGRPGSQYTDEQRELGLRALAKAHGNARMASRDLEAIGAPVPTGTLRDWRKQEPERYNTIRQQIQPELDAQLEERWQEVMDVTTRGALEAAEVLRGHLPEMDPRDVPKALTSLSTSGGIATDKVFGYQGRPSTIVQHDHRSAMRQLQRAGLTIEGEAEEIEG